MWTLFMDTSSPSNLRNVWNYPGAGHLTSDFQDIATAEEKSDEMLLNQDASSADFHVDGSQANSVTNAIIRELKGAWSRALGAVVEDTITGKVLAGRRRRRHVRARGQWAPAPH
eukprot:CAMPEP_0201621128 /NCGR_PEP_ID=MMETSP0492-20130828/46016_1 /ASSEMBLY_ACC=CAM_ASM_000837 /TAXON_ID=420259 /ORGANISM="Thalassiosira gravida, Strain GMp14c1" /LENGTH=113 /DNA_ID=CAMNT_0048090571 /DNA_START=284 /DNA_END=626 /DNA_ORIENTATION=-